MAKYAIPQDSSTLSAWWRAKRYVVSGGVLRPLGAMQAYDPRANYVPTLRGRAEAPYQSLLRVLPRLQRRPVAFRSVNALTPDAERELTAWCAAHGLLGVLPHRTLMACVPVRVPAGDGGTMEWPHRYVRTALGWRRLTVEELVHGDLEALERHPRSARTAASRLLPAGTVLIAGVRQHSDMLYEAPLREAWARFFPDVSPAQHDAPTESTYPLPLTAEFWRAYGEPVDDFLDAALALYEALDALRAPATGRAGAESRAVGIQRLNALVAPIAPHLALRTDRGEPPFEQRWASPSLLATFALMALQDLAAGMRPEHCSRCGTLFMTASPLGRYCSNTCRYTAQKRAQRDHKRKARESHTGTERPSSARGNRRPSLSEKE